VQVDSLSIQGFTVNNNYYWKVAGINENGTGDYSSIWNFHVSPIGINNYTSSIPKEYKLYNNYPNPFNPTTKIRFDIPKNSLVRIEVYDVTGREIQNLVNNELKAGTYECEFSGFKYSSGIYFYKLQADNYVSVKKMILVK
jgi:hypothetical protein